MSTKTTFKRVALVAVAALGFGLLSVVPSSAATPLTADTVTVVSSTTSVAVGASSSVTIKFSGICQGAVNWETSENFNVYQVYLESFSSIPSSYAKPVWAAVPDGGAGTSTDRVNLAALDAHTDTPDSFNITLGCAAAGPYVGFATIAWTPVSSGSYAFKVASMPIGAVFNGYGTASYTVTAADKAAANSASTTAVTTPTGTGSGTDTTGIYAPKAAAAAVANILVTASNGATSGALADSDALAKVATISGPGLLSFDGGATKGRYVGSSAGSLAQTLIVYGDGSAGVATITITDSKTQFTKTKTVTFVGSTASIKEDEDNSPSKAIIGVDSTGTLAYLGYDSADNLSETAPASIDYATSSDKTIATVTALNGTVTVTGKKAGTVTITACNTDSCTGATIKATSTVVIGNTTVASVTMSWDKTEYAPGEKMVLTVSGLDKNGSLVADDSYDLFEVSPAANVSLLSVATGTQWTAPSDTSIGLVGGKKTYSVYAPLSAGSVIVAGKASTTGTPGVSASAAVVNAALDAATAAGDAAAEATDAANAATDAANAAAEAADAATAAAQDAADAVAALSAQVADLVAGLKAQLTALTNLVIKIQKKVKA